MILRFWIRLAEVALTLLLATAVIFAWREARSDRAQLQSQLAAANQALAAASARQQDRDAKLNDTLAGIAAEKKAAVPPDEILAGIASEVGLPTPLSLQSTPAASGTIQPAHGKPHIAKSAPDTAAGNPAQADPLHPAGIPGHRPAGTTSQPADLNPAAELATAAPSDATSDASPQLPSAPGAKIPAVDIRPLFDYILDCKACQTKLAASQADLADEKSKSATLTKSRDDALRAAKGGSLWKRTVLAMKWFALGAAAGAIAVKTVR
jgi:hypothetical protein